MFKFWWQSLAMRRMAAAARSSRARLRCESLEERDTPAGIIAAGAAAGSAPVVTVYDATTLAVKFTINAYDSSFTGGVNVAVGDVNGDGTPDIITGPGLGGGPDVKVWSGVDGSLLGTLTVGDADSRSGASVAAADFNGDGKADIVVGTMRNGEPLIQVMQFSDGTVLQGETPFAGAASVSVAVGDVNDDGTPDIIAGSGAGIASSIQVFSGVDGSTLDTLSPFESSFVGGVQVSS
ncbi:MAG TPA: VCBS repeat-containing protein, partial [Urbifossiella sp.]